jgi:predicted Zn-dependent protease
MSDPRTYFFRLADEIARRLRPGEFYTCHLQGEDSEFVRLNRNRVRQAGQVRQQSLRLDLIEGPRHAAARFSISGAWSWDRSALGRQLDALRRHLEPDPYLWYATEVHDTDEVRGERPPAAGSVIPHLLGMAQGLDVVGIWAAGQQYEGFANACGQRNWHALSSFNLDWSCHLDGMRAVKSNLSGTRWDEAALQREVTRMRERLGPLSRVPHRLRPGRYRSFLAPAALKEILELVSWGGFGLKDHRTAQPPLIKMIREGRRLDAIVTLRENHAGGLTPRFTAAGFIKPPSVTLVERGHYRDCLVSPAASREYGVPVNAARETPDSLEMDPGTLHEDEILGQLDTGLYLSHLWYCNFSDRNDCRITGMTRYACLWVEHGEILAPIEPMRFDDSLYRILGEGLAALTSEPHTLIDPGSYGRRSLSMTRLPGALVEGLRFTL